MRRALLLLGPVVVACAGTPSPTPATPADAPPAARVGASAARKARAPVVAAARRPAAHEYFGERVVDDYEWLEDAESEETKAFVAAQNALARSTLGALPERPAIERRVAAILGDTSRDWTALRAVGKRLFALELAPPKQQAALVVLPEASSEPPRAKVVVDPTVLDPSGHTTIDFFEPSPDGRLVAVSLSKDGTESGDLHLYEVASGRDLGETIARVHGGTAGGSVAWTDGGAFYYTRYPRRGERPEVDLDFYQQVWLHKVGTPEAKDAVALGRDLPRIAEVRLARSDDGRRILAEVANGDGGEIEHHVLDGGRWARLTRFADEVGHATFGPDGRVYAVARKGAPRGKVVAFAAPWSGAPSEILPQGDAVVTEVVVTKPAIYSIEIADGPSQVRRVPLAPKPEPLATEAKKASKPGKTGKRSPAPPATTTTIALGARGPVAAAVLPIPPVSSVADVLRVGDDLLLRIESYTEAPRWVAYRAAEHRLVDTSLARKAPFDTSDMIVRRVACASKDGTRVPMTIIDKRGGTGPRPALLTAYGGFGISMRPRLRAPFRVWLDQGGVVAEASLRGGGERGDAWHRAGQLTNKQNVFDDFAACAQALFDLGYTRPEHLAITGRSNGGLLMGAALVQHPEMFRAVASGVGLYDMLRSELSPNGAFITTEYGSVKDEAQYRALRAYSPLHNVADDVVYPAVFLFSGANDPRVDPYHSRKMAARLQAATSSDRPILLRESSGSGHGIGAPLAAQIEETTDVLAFLLHETR